MFTEVRLPGAKKRSLAPLAMAPLAVLLLMATVFAIYGLYPFGVNTLAWCDMNQQVIPVLLEFKDILAGKQSLFLNMESAGGINFWGVFLFFISSPFSFLVAFVGKADMSLFMNVMVTLKMMACAFTAAVFFRRQFKSLPGDAAACLSVMYAFCGYSMLFYQNVVWLDMMYLFPLLLCAFDRLLNEQKILPRLLPYIAVLCAMLAVNFYLSYMVVVFIILGMGLYLFFCVESGRRGQCISLLCVGSALSALITAVIWLPSFLQYLASARTSSLLQNLSGGRFTTQIYTTVPLLFCSALVFAVLPFFIGKSEWQNRNRRMKINCILMLFSLMLIPILIEPINKMWHTGSYQAFPVRYGYITIFLGLILAAAVLQRCYEQPDAATKKLPALLGACAVAVLHAAAYWLLTTQRTKLSAYTSTLWGDKKSFTWLLFFFILAFLCYFTLVYLFRFRHLSKRVFTLLLCLLLIGECMFSGGVYIGTAANGVQGYRQAVDLEGKIQDDGFYRVKTQAKYFDANLMGGIGFASLSHYTSLNSQDYMFAMKRLGYSSYWMEVNSNNGTLLTDALLSNKYKVVRAGDVLNDSRMVYRNRSYAIVQNPLSLPLGIRIPAGRQVAESLPDTTRLDVQEYLYSALLGGQDKLFTQYYYSTSDNIDCTYSDCYSLKKLNDSRTAAMSWTVNVTGRQVLYFDCFMYLSNRLRELINDSFKIYVNGVAVEQSYPNQHSNGLYELGTFENEKVTVQVELLKSITAKSFGVYGLDTAKLESAVSSAPGVEMQVKGNQVTAACEAEQGDSLYISLPYQKGCRAYVNGSRVTVEKVNDDFMMIPLEEGENQIALTFLPDGFIAGLALSTAGLLLLPFALWFLRRRRGELPKIVQRVLSALFAVLTAGVFTALYIFPVLVYFAR